MLKIRRLLVVLGLLLCSAASAGIQVSIGINVPVYPEFVVVPGYPVYYAPRLQANFFFYDGMYWVYQDDYWYMSSWYNGPWLVVEPEYVPVFVLRVPVRYYRRPPVYFLEWRQDAPPRWGDHWGRDWEQHRSGWDRWERSAAPAAAPLPDYQRAYSGERYPRQVEQQQELQQQKYRYQPRDPVVRQQSRELGVQTAPAQIPKLGSPVEKNGGQQDRSMSHQPGRPVIPGAESPQKQSEDVQGSTPIPAQRGRQEGREKPPLSVPSQREQAGQITPAQPEKQRGPTERSAKQPDTQRSAPQNNGPATRHPQSQQKGDEEVQDSSSASPQQGPEQGEQPAPRSQDWEPREKPPRAKRNGSKDSSGNAAGNSIKI